MQVVAEVITAGGVLLMLGLVLRNIYDKLGAKTDKSVCEKSHDAIAQRFESGNTRFLAAENTARDLMKELKEQRDILIRVDERVRNLAKKNGVN
uniref:Uncharacterized protein n=1 Tax=viral metagenome TaxID=1070528 RepID=A0A6M3JJX4_9ZZZZ